MKNKRAKKWIGAAIGAGVSLIGNLISKNKEQEYLNDKRLEEAKLISEQSALQTAQNLTNKYANQEYADKFKEKIVFKHGGAIYTDRIKNIKRFKCGGRRK